MGSKLFENILHPEDFDAVLAHHARFINASDNAVYEVEYRMKHACGEWRWLRSRDILFARTSDGKGRQILGTCQEITEEKKTIAKIQDSELKYRTIFNNSLVGIFRSKLDGSALLDFNDKFIEIMGRTRAEMQGKPSIGYWADLTERERLIQDLKKKGEVSDFECRMLTKNGEVKTCLGSVRLYPEQGILEGIIIDISERKKAEIVLAQKFEMAEQIGESIGAGLAVIGRDYRVIWANKTLRNIGVVPGKECFKIFNHLSGICPDCGVEKVFTQNSILDIHEYKTVNSKGDTVWIELRVTPIKDKDGNVTSALELAVPITERKKMEESLRESENRFEKISSQTQGMLYQFKKRPDGTYCVPFTSEAIRSIFGCSPEDVREDFSPIAKVILDEDREKVIGSIEDSARNLTPWMCEYRVKTSDQRVKYLWGQSIPEKLSDGSIIWHGYNLDITDRKAMDQVLLENQEKFSALFNSNPDPAVFYNADFQVVEANPKFCKYFGYSLSELKDKDIADLIVPEERREESKIVRKQALSGPIEVVATRKRKDGSLVSVLMAGGPVRLGNKVVGTMFVYKDISDIITVQEALDEALAKAELLNEKLKVVGSLTRHDVRNKLSAVTGYSYLIKKQHPDLVDVNNSLGRMEQAVKEAVKIFDFAKTYEQIGVENLVDVDVHKAVHEAASMFSDLIFKVVNECAGLAVKADSLLRQLIYNLIDNTRKYGKKTTVAKVYYRKTASSQLQLVYEDDGVGIPDESKGNLFKKGFSTGGSSGFGLFLSKKIIDVYGWNIEEVGEPGKGAKFIITIH